MLSNKVFAIKSLQFNSDHSTYNLIPFAIIVFLFSILIRFLFSLSAWFGLNSLGEHPAAMQRGCANNTISASIFLYIIILSMVCQRFNQITHGYGIIPYDVIRWMRLFKVYEQNAIQFNRIDDYYEILDTGHRSVESPSVEISQRLYSMR